MDPLTPTHWTEESANDFLYKIAADFAQQIENYLDATEDGRTRFAATLGVTPGRVSQILNNPGNLTLKKCIQYARAIGRKVALVAYDDRDPGNVNGPINAQVFERCWEQVGRPSDVLAVEDSGALFTYCIGAEPSGYYPMNLKTLVEKGTSRFGSCGYERQAATDPMNHVNVKRPLEVINYG